MPPVFETVVIVLLVAVIALLARIYERLRKQAETHQRLLRHMGLARLTEAEQAMINSNYEQTPQFLDR